MKNAAFPINPGKVLTRALQSGLTATAYLARGRVTKATKHLYWGGKGRKGIRKILKEALLDYQRSVKERRPDARHLQRVENNIRRNHNKIVLNASVPYGNVEEKRRRQKEDRKYINILADYYGARIRNLGASGFPFPTPVRMITKDKSVKRIYPGSARIPKYVPTHTTPELDFVDMIRSHGIELARQCMKYSVPIRDAKRYLDGLIERLVPYLEYVYTERRRGEKGFIHEGVRELRNIVHEIQAVYGGVNGRPPSITGEISSHLMDVRTEDQAILEPLVGNETDRLEAIMIDEPREVDDSESEDVSEGELDTFFSDVTVRCDLDLHPEWRVHVEKVVSLVKNGILTRADAEFAMKNLLESSRMMGSAFHDFIANSNFSVRPFSLFGSIRHGDEMVTEETDFLFTCEVTVADGRGRVDILVFRRKNLERADESSPVTIWEPCILIEVKTKCFYKLDLYATSTKSKDLNRRVVEPIIDRRKSEDMEWQDVINSTPTVYGKKQLDAYEKVILSSYRKYARSDVSPPEMLMKGVLVVDLKENWETLRSNIRNLILKAYSNSQDGTFSKGQLFYPTLGDKSFRMGLVVYSDCENRNTIPTANIQEFNPFQYSRFRDDDREFVLYLTVLGKGSPSQSAAEIAASWHGLKYIHERVRGKHRDVVWFDFTGEFKSLGLREQNLRVGLHSKSIQRLLRKKISFVDMSKALSSYVNERDTLETIGRKLSVSLRNKRGPFIVVTGLDKVRRSTSKQKTSFLDEFLLWFIEMIPRRLTVLWFDGPVPLSQTSQKYDTRCVAPFYPSSPWMHVIDEIVYNLPMAPRRYGSYVPVDDDVRWVVTERKNDCSIEPVLIMPLYQWGEKFRPDSNREQNIDKQQVFYLRSNYSSIRKGYLRNYCEADNDDVLELVPHLSRFYQKADSKEESQFLIQKQEPSGISSDPPSLLSRVVFEPYQHQTSVDADGRVKKLEPLEMINHTREYRVTRLHRIPPRKTTRPPHIGLLKFHGSNRLTLVRKELSGIRCIAKTIAKRHGDKKEWREFLESLDRLVDRNLVDRYLQSDVFNVLRTIRVFLETHDLSKEIWMVLKKQRSWIPDGLLENQKIELKKLLAKDPDLLLIVGNHLFLLLLISLYESGTLDSPRSLTEKLWNYLVPFQLIGVGFSPEYHSQHNTGESFLHRTKLIDRLRERAKGLKKILRGEQVSDVLFGRAYFVERNNSESPQQLFLAFQTSLGSHEMSMIYLKHPSGKEGLILDVLKGFCKNKPFWGTSDLTLLRELSERVDPEQGVDIMVATQRGIQGFWAYNEKTSNWLPVGRIEYYRRRRETVTLLMSMTLRDDSTLLEVAGNNIRAPPRNLADDIQVGLGFISAVFRDCISVKCHVYLDHEAQMFRISLLNHGSEDEIGQLLIKRTVDVLEILRRPDFSCEPVVIDENHYVWNRFDDIEFDEDVKILRPFVLRSDPFKIESVSLPPTAEAFLSFSKGVVQRIKISHDYHICPLRSQNLESITKHSKATKRVIEYLQDVDGHPGQPEPLFNESIYRHGACWRINFYSDDKVPEEIRELEQIKFTGPALAAFLEAGAISYRAYDGQWMLYDIQIPESKDLPKEFRESIHVMRWRKERAAYPGIYLLDGWSPEIRRFENRVEFRLVSELTLQKMVHIVIVPKVEMLEREHLSLLLKEGMEEVLDQGGFSDNKTMKQLVDKEIEDHLSLIQEKEIAVLQFASVDITRDEAGGMVIVANFATEESEYVSIQVTQWIHTYQGWTEMAGGVDPDLIEQEVGEKLEQYNIDDETIVRVIEEVKNVLLKKGVIFFRDH
ncbi:MAG: hypothetical protein KAW94_00335 [Candidatus Thorarchaeota archaeon]|nr:hypothetical protein [Candidatus Thorarchaeota archaeon]